MVGNSFNPEDHEQYERPSLQTRIGAVTVVVGFLALLALSLYGCADTPSITAPQIIPPFPTMPAETKTELQDCCTIVITMPDGSITHKVKPGTEHIWQYLATLHDYKAAVDYSRALVDQTNQ